LGKALNLLFALIQKVIFKGDQGGICAGGVIDVEIILDLVAAPHSKKWPGLARPL